MSSKMKDSGEEKVSDEHDIMDNNENGAESFNESEWVLELRQALEEQCGLYDVVRISEGRTFPQDLRITAWLACLEIPWNCEETFTGFSAWNGMFNLDNQSDLHADCRKLIDVMENVNESERLSLISDTESVVTAYCLNKKCAYDRGLLWSDILTVLLPFRLSVTCLYEVFSAIIERFIPKDGPNNDIVHHLFRLIVLYHDPELCNFLDSKKVAFDKFCFEWFATLFAHGCQRETTMAIWDLYLQNNDPFLVFFLGLILLFSAKEQVLQMLDASGDDILVYLRGLVKNMSVEDVRDFYELAHVHLNSSPKSLRETNWTNLFGNRPLSPSKRLHIPIAQALCLPVTTEEIVEACERRTGCRFFLIDCRPPEQYNNSHLTTAFHLDANLLMQDSSAFDAAVERLLLSQKQAIEANSVAGGEHLCFMGSGFEAEDQFMHMVVARMLQKHYKYISLADGGYEALLHYIDMHHMPMEKMLVGMQVHKMKAIKAGKQQLSSAQVKPPSSDDAGFFGRLRSAVKVLPNVSEVKEKLSSYMTNAPASTSAPLKHVSAEDRSRKLHYRPRQDVFVFGDTDDDPDSFDTRSDSDGESYNLKDFLHRPDVLAHFDCYELLSDVDKLPAHLVITETELYNFRPCVDDSGMAFLNARHDLMDVLKIVCKRKLPELITIKYGNSQEGDTTVHRVERYYINKSGDAIKAIKMQILKLMDENLEGQSRLHDCQPNEPVPP